MACSNCKCNPEKDIVEGGVSGTTRYGDLDFVKESKILNQLIHDLQKEVNAINRFLKTKYPEILPVGSCSYWSDKQDNDARAKHERDWLIHDLREQGYLVEAPQTAPTRTTGYTEE
jgi:hypothetical protein